MSRDGRSAQASSLNSATSAENVMVGLGCPRTATSFVAKTAPPCCHLFCTSASEISSGTVAKGAATTYTQFASGAPSASVSCTSAASPSAQAKVRFWAANAWAARTKSWGTSGSALRVMGGTAVAVAVAGSTPGMAGVGGSSPVGSGRARLGVGGGVRGCVWVETAVGNGRTSEVPHAVSQNRAKRYNPPTKRCPLVQTFTRKIILCPR